MTDKKQEITRQLVSCVYGIKYADLSSDTIETAKKCIEDHRREADEASMFRKLWPDWMASLLMRFYKQSYKAYREDS